MQDSVKTCISCTDGDNAIVYIRYIQTYHIYYIYIHFHVYQGMVGDSNVTYSCYLIDNIKTTCYQRNSSTQSRGKVHSLVTIFVGLLSDVHVLSL